MKFNNFVASCKIYCVVYRPICWHRSRCHADNRHHQQTHVTAPGVARRGSSEYIMDDTRLIVEVEKLKVIYDPKN